MPQPFSSENIRKKEVLINDVAPAMGAAPSFNVVEKNEDADDNDSGKKLDPSGSEGSQSFKTASEVESSMVRIIDDYSDASSLQRVARESVNAESEDSEFYRVGHQSNVSGLSDGTDMQRVVSAQLSGKPSDMTSDSDIVRVDNATESDLVDKEFGNDIDVTRLNRMSANE